MVEMVYDLNVNRMLLPIPHTRGEPWYLYQMVTLTQLGSCIRSNLCYLICYGHLIRSRAVTNRISFQKRPIFVHAFATCSELPSNQSTMLETINNENTGGALYSTVWTPSTYMFRIFVLCKKELHILAEKKREKIRPPPQKKKKKNIIKRGEK